jgi:hypothetical protein
VGDVARFFLKAGMSKGRVTAVLIKSGAFLGGNGVPSHKKLCEDHQPLGRRAGTGAAAPLSGG